jgi:DNA helicase II / ATP-dependent DNA helicase PcrA
VPEHPVEEVGNPRRSGRSSVGAFGGAPDAPRAAAIAANRREIVEAARRSRGEATSGAEAMGLRAGQDVRHPKFGEGVVLQVKGEGDKAEALVRFADAGERWLLLSWAPLERA